MAGITMPQTSPVRPGEDPYRPRLVRVLSVREEIAPTERSRPVVTLELERDGYRGWQEHEADTGAGPATVAGARGA